MDNKDKMLELELKLIREEIRMLRQILITLCAGVAALFIFVFPQLTLVLLLLTLLVLIALLISPARRQVFPYLFAKEKEEES